MANIPGAPLTYFNDGGLEWFFWSEILAKGDCFGSMKDAGIFLGRKKKELRDFFGYAKKVVIFLGRQILKVWFFGV